MGVVYDSVHYLGIEPPRDIMYPTTVTRVVPNLYRFLIHDIYDTLEL